MANYTTINKSTDYFNNKIYTGNAGTQSISSVGFQPDWVWIKERNLTSSHALTDSVRGVTKKIKSDSNDVEETNTNLITSFDSDGFSLGDNGNANQSSSQTYVSWNFKAGTSFTNDASSTGIGTIDSTGSFNNDSGFSIVTFTGTGSNGTIKHGLNSAPKVVLLRSRSHGQNFMVGANIDSTVNFTDALALNQNYAIEDYDGYWNDTAPTNSVISLGSHNNTNGSGYTYVCYNFVEKQGFSKFGRYEGSSNSDGPYIHLGFKPAWLMVKMVDGADDWQILDNKRSPHNIVGGYLNANSYGVTIENDVIDFLSSGFKLRTTAGSWNHSSYQYTYMAFAESPFVTSTGIPTTAR